MSLLANLPVDTHPANDHEISIINQLFPSPTEAMSVHVQATDVSYGSDRQQSLLNRSAHTGGGESSTNVRRAKDDDAKQCGGHTKAERRQLYLEMFQEGLVVVLLFVVFTHPQSQKVVDAYLSFMSPPLRYLCQIAMLVLVFWTVKYKIIHG